MTLHDLPHVNASLNALATLLIVAGFLFIRRKRVSAHRACMVSATVVSAAFLICYLIYHGAVGHTRFTHAGWVRTAYYALLISHVFLAATVPVLVGMALWRALTGQIEKHRRIVRWALPIWLYVSVTGVVVYAVLYHLAPGSGREATPSLLHASD